VLTLISFDLKSAQHNLVLGQGRREGEVRRLPRLIDCCFTARQYKIGQFVPIYQRGLLAHAFEDSQRGTYKNIQLHAIQ